MTTTLFMVHIPLSLVQACGSSPEPSTTESNGSPGVAMPEDPGAPLPGPQPVPTVDCPPPPDDAITFELGTFLGDQIFYRTDEGREGYYLALSGLSYVHEQPCNELLENMAMFQEVKSGERPGEYTVELMLDIPGPPPHQWLGEHPMHDGHLFSSMSAHTAKLGWNNGEGYQWVHALPNGWTQSTVCIGTISPDYVYLTFLWDPVDGPFTTNEHTQVHHPIWFKAELWSYWSDPIYDAHRGCASDTWVGAERDEWRAIWTWPGMY